MRELKYSILKTEDEIIFMLENDKFFNSEFEYHIKDKNILFISDEEIVFVSLGNEDNINVELKFFITDEETETIISEFEIT